MSTLIAARGLSAGYGRMAVVRDLDLHVDAGEVVALVGPNGAGKTTTLLTLAGELAPLVVTSLLQAARAAADAGIGVLLVEQHVRRALEITARIYVMERGRIAMSGTADEVGGRLDLVEAAYLTDRTDA